MKLNDCEYQPCNICEGVFQSILNNFKDIPIDRALAKAMEEFNQMHDQSDCIEFYTCLPIARRRVSSRIIKSDK